jgi:hypothetical protein
LAKLFPEKDVIPYIKPLELLTVAGLIKFLQTQDPNLPVAHQMCSENCLLELDLIEVRELCEMRPDGWVANKRPDKPTVKYLVFPGN